MQMYLGHQFMKKEFGIVPRVGWMIDAFGHSSTNAALFADFGFDAIYFSRIDEQMRNSSSPQTFLWRPYSKSFGGQKEILAGVYNKDHYDWPTGFRIDERVDDDVGIQDDPTLMNYNAKSKATQIINYAQDMIELRANDHNVMILMGGDFTFMNAYQSFSELQKIITICNQVQDVNIEFIMSTPSRFTDALKAENVTWPVREDDLFPYVIDQQYWTGFFTSRPAIKKHVKDASAFFNAEQNVFARMQIDQNTTTKDIQNINTASFQFNDALAVVQHHDGITGTEAQYVAMDYQWRLFKRQQNSLPPYQKWIKERMKAETGISVKNKHELHMCTGSQNDTVLDCPVWTHKNVSEFIVAIHNPRSTN